MKLGKPGLRPLYELAPTTRRAPNLIARRHGFDDVYDLAQSLPQNAQIVDVGAGLSGFGKKVARIRDDIDWVNVDLRYANPMTLMQAEFNAPTNLSFSTANVLNLGTELGERRFDRVYSYWLMPHMMFHDYLAALEAAENLLKTAKSDGQISVGPCITTELGYNAITLNAASDDAELDQLAGHIVAMTALGPQDYAKHRLMNHVGQFYRHLGL